MPMSVQEQSSSFTTSTTKSVQVVSGNAEGNTGVGEIFVPACDTTSSTSTSQKCQEVSTSSANSQNVKSTSSNRQHDISSSTSASSIGSDGTLRDVARFEDFVFRPTIMNFDSMMGITGSEFEDVSRDVCQANDGQTFEMKLDVQDYKPDEIKVKVSDNMVTVSAKQEQRKDESNFSTRQFSKKFSIPQGVKAENIACNLTTQGVLKISAPIERQAITSTSSTVTTGGQETSIKQAQHKQVSKTQTQESTTSSRKSSLNSDVSSIRDFASGGFDDIILRPRRIDLSSLMNTRMDSGVEKISKELCNINDGKKFEMKLEVQNFKPEEVQVKITKNLIKIEGKHDSEFASRQFFKEFTIPYGVKTDTIQCSMNDDGILTISAPIQPSSMTSALNQSQRSEQQVTSSTSTQQQVHKKLQETGRTDSTGSISSTTSSIRETSRRLMDDDFILRPIMNFDIGAYLGKESQFEDVSKQVCHVNDGKKFEMKLEVPDFKPEELQVKISNNMVTIEGKQETEFSSRQFSKKFSIPQGVKPENITSSLSPKGVLTISAPVETTCPNANKQEQIIQQHQTHSTTSSTTSGNISQQQQQQKNLQHSDSNTSISSTLSNLSSFSNKLDHDFVLRPVMDFDAILAKDTRFEDISKEVCQINDGKKFETKLQVPDFKPEELEVKISNNMVTISGKQEMRQENQFSSKQFFKKFSIPQGVKPETITSSLSPQGVLTISAPIQESVKSLQSLSEQSLTTASNVSNTQSKQQVEQEVRQNVQQMQSQQTSKVSSQTQQMHQTVQSENANNQSMARRLFDEDCVLRPIMDFNLNSLMGRESNFEDVSKQICQVSDGKKFEMKLDVPDFKPEELELKISNNLVTIQGKQESRQENNFSSRQFCKKFSIPQGVKPENITSSLSPKGVLTISAPIEIDQSQTQLSQLQQGNISRTTVTSSTSVTKSEHVSGSGNTGNARQISILKPKMNPGNMVTSANSNFEDISKELYHVCDGQTFEMKLEVQEFRPEEIDVKISNNLVTIEGKQEMREENNFRSRQFCKKFTIPPGVKPENISCSLTPEGTLTISAPIEQSQNQQSLVESQNQNQSKSSEVQSSQTSKKVSSTFSSSTSTSQQVSSSQS